MLSRFAMLAVALAFPAMANAQSSNTSSNSSSNNGVVRETVIDTYCDDGFCTRTSERSVYHDGSNSRWHPRDDDWHEDRRADDDRRFMNWALRHFDRNRDGQLGRREYERALYAYRRR